MENLLYGISPLHAWIRALEFCLNLGYRNIDGLKCWRVSNSKKEIFSKRKSEIQTKIWNELGLKMDFPKPGGCGTSNDGNMARMAFSDSKRKTFGEILNLEPWLLDKLQVILISISCNMEIDSKKFGEYCDSLFELYVKNYNWYPLPATLHKVLAHGKDIIENSILSVGMLSEQARESRNKLYRQYREYHARKISMSANLTDVFNRSLESSDPKISDYSLEERKKKIKKLDLPLEVKILLKHPNL